MSPTRVALAVAALVLFPAAAGAESRRYGSFELGANNYYPNIDAQPGLSAPLPFQEIFGTGRAWMFRAGVSGAIFTSPGSLEVGFKTGYFHDSGKALQKDASGNITDTRSADSTSLSFIPTSIMVTYRFDRFADVVPLAPYFRMALERYNWWISSDSGGSKTGATNGWSWTAGVALQLDFFDRGLARELDRDTGINHTYAFFDVTDSHVDDFGSSTSWDLSDKRLSLGFGLMFVF